jgi:DNA-binding CsgD family transcriptional regulator
MAPENTSSTKLVNPRILLTARTLWVAVLVASMSLYVISLLEVYFPLNGFLVANLNAPGVLPAIGIPWDWYLLYYGLLTFIPAPTFYATALIIYHRKSDDWMALLVTGMGALIGINVTPTVGVLMVYSLTLVPPFGFVVAYLINIGIGLIPIVFCIFPNGRFVPRWTRSVMIVWAIWFSVLILFSIALQNEAQVWLVTPSMLLFFGIGFYAQVYRYRHIATLTERVQARWVVVGFTSASVMVLLSVVLSFLVLVFRPEIDTSVQAIIGITLTMLVIASMLMIPCSLLVAIMRYHLWDIDLVINRALVYGIVTASLILFYFVCVLLLQQMFQSMTGGSQSSLAIAGSTLAIALMFEPMRKRIQTLIDHRFFKRIDMIPIASDAVLQPQSDSMTSSTFLHSAPRELGPEPLTERELEVLNLIAQGLSNREIADKLVIAEGTVKRHVTNIYGKLDVRSRTQAIVRARSLQMIA